MVNQMDILEEKIKIPFSISKYMLSVILPKCTMVHGEIISTIYLQLALYTNKQKKCLPWQRNVCWTQIGTIAQNTGYNPRTVTKILKILEQLHLINIEKQGKLNKFRIINHQLQNEVDIDNFNIMVENLLLSGFNKTKTQKYKEMFNEFHTVISYTNELSKNELNKSIHFEDVNLLREWLNQAEKIYKGSSLFFMINVGPQIYKYLNDCELNNLLFISEKNRAIQIGSSQSTISRYIASYINAGCLVIEEGNINKPVKLSLNKEFINQNQNISFDGVVKIMLNNIFVCPICNKEFAENRSLGVHLQKTKDSKHILLNHLKNQNKFSHDELNNIYLSNKEDFDILDDIEYPKQEVVKPKIQDEYLKIPSGCTMSCKECRKNWELDFFNDCTHERKTAYMKEYGIEEVEEKKLVKTASVIKNNSVIEVTKEDFDIVKPVKKARKINPDSAPELLKYFYGLTGGNCPNFGKECAQIKNLLKKGITPEQIKMTMEYLYKKGSFDLRFLNNSVNDALLQKQYLDDMLVDGTDAFLVKMYYDGLNLPINMQTLIKDVQKIKETMNSGLTYEQTKMVIKYMVDIKCPTLNFIGSKRNEALSLGKNNTNPTLFDRSSMTIIENELINGRIKLKKVDDKLKPEAYKLAKKIFFENKFVDKFNHFEWAWKVGLELDYDMYQLALKSKTQESTFDKVLEDTRISEEQRQAIIKIKEKFDEWLNKQCRSFDSAK